MAVPWCPGSRSLVAVDDAAAGEVVRAQLHHHAVLGEDPDVVLAHLAGDVREDLVPVGQLDAEHRVRERLHDAALDLDDSVLLRHVLRNLRVARVEPLAACTTPWAWWDEPSGSPVDPRRDDRPAAPNQPRGT